MERKCSSAANSEGVSAENRKSGDNPERYRHCMCEGDAQDESRPLKKFEKVLHLLLIRKSGDLLEQFLCSPVCGSAEFTCRKTAATVTKNCRSFSFEVML